MFCSNCLEPQETEDGIVDFYDNLCEYCHEQQEKAKILSEYCQDFDYSLNF